MTGYHVYEQMWKVSEELLFHKISNHASVPDYLHLHCGKQKVPILALGFWLHLSCSTWGSFVTEVHVDQTTEKM